MYERMWEVIARTKKVKGTNIPPTEETCVKTQSVASDSIENTPIKKIRKKPGTKPIEEKVTPEFLDALTAYASQSISNMEIAQMLQISSSSFYKLMSELPEFKAAYEKGIDNRKYELEKALLKRASGFAGQEIKTETDADGNVTKKIITDKQYVPDTTALIFALKNLHGDKYKDVIESVNTVNINVQQIQNIPDEELLKYASVDLIETDYQID